MIRIYLDSNVFSKLRKNEIPAYHQLNELLSKYKHNLTFLFSYAHIRDKKKDPTNWKFKDFEFMETLIMDNYIAYHPLEKDTTFYLATPTMVYYDNINHPDDLRSTFNFFEPSEDDDEDIANIKRILKNILYKTPYNLELEQDVFEKVTAEQKQFLERVLPQDKSLTLGSLIDRYIDYFDEMYTNHETYKQLCKLIDESVNNGKIHLKNEHVDFNEALKDTIIQKTFLNFIKSSVKPNENGNYPLYEFYLQAYNSLDFLGISKDKITRKNNYHNLFNDGLHSYFANFCDYLVTEDESLSEKSKALYTTFNIQTKVLSVNEFIEILPVIGKDSEKDVIEFFSKFYNDRENGIKTPIQIQNGILNSIKINQAYLNSFDLLFEHIIDDEVHYYLCEERKNHLAGSNFRERGMIIDKAIKLFGMDGFNVGPFNFEKEIDEMRKDKWEGRAWRFGNCLLHIHINESFQSFCLSIQPIRE